MKHTMRSLAIIPARGGSKRLPRKNILNFLGKPILIWTAEAAKLSNCFEKVIISTEDPEIASIANKYGFEVAKRQDHLATDLSTCADVCLDLLTQLESSGDNFDSICCLYATAPLRNAQDIVNTMALLGSKNSNLADFAFATTEYSHSPYQMLIEDNLRYLVPSLPFVARQKSQHLPKAVIGNGSTYAARTEAFKLYKDFTGARLKGYLMPKMRSIDIDTQEDFEIALHFAKMQKEF